MEKTEFIEIFTAIINACKAGKISKRQAKVELKNLVKSRDEKINWIGSDYIPPKPVVKQRRIYFGSHKKPGAKLRGDFRPWRGKK